MNTDFLDKIHEGKFFIDKKVYVSPKKVTLITLSGALSNIDLLIYMSKNPYTELKDNFQPFISSKNFEIVLKRNSQKLKFDVIQEEDHYHLYLNKQKVYFNPIFKDKLYLTEDFLSIEQDSSAFDSFNEDQMDLHNKITFPDYFVEKKKVVETKKEKKTTKKNKSLSLDVSTQPNPFIDETSILHTPVDESAVLHNTVDESAVLHTPVDESAVLHTPVDESTVLHTPVDESHILHTPVDESAVLHNIEYESTVLHDTGYESAVLHDTGYESQVIHDTVDESAVLHNTGYETPVVHNTGYETPVVHDTEYESAVVHNTEYESTVIHDTGYESQVIHDTGYETTVIHDTGYESQVVDGTGYETQDVQDIVYETPVIHDTGYETQVIQSNNDEYSEFYENRSTDFQSNIDELNDQFVLDNNEKDMNINDLRIDTGEEEPLLMYQQEFISSEEKETPKKKVSWKENVIANTIESIQNERKDLEQIKTQKESENFMQIVDDFNKFQNKINNEKPNQNIKPENKLYQNQQIQNTKSIEFNHLNKIYKIPCIELEESIVIDFKNLFINPIQPNNLILRNNLAIHIPKINKYYLTNITGNKFLIYRIKGMLIVTNIHNKTTKMVKNKENIKINGNDYYSINDSSILIPMVQKKFFDNQYGTSINTFIPRI